ncbi:MAG: response regulator transcription factor [bacterium]|nr:response regulator transcription factor [bacterium]
MNNRVENTPAQRLLVVDDDKEIVRVLRAYLEQAGYHVFTAYDGSTALHIAQHEHPHLIILDWMMPGKDGLEVTRLIRANPALAQTYILMLTARIDDTDKVVGLELGADDYVTKPFNPREVVARVRATFRRLEMQEQGGERVYFYRDLMLDVVNRKVTMMGKIVDLTPTEFNLLAVLMQRPGYPFSRAELVQKRLGYDYDTLERTLDSHIRNLRKKIEPDPNQPIYVQTVYGVGYRLGEP